jgi:uncharacterized protein YcbK (DUF882 family)
MSSAPSPEPSCDCGRRRQLLRGILAGIAACVAIPARPAAADGRRLVLLNTHTGEVLDTVYWEHGTYRAGDLGRLDWMFRDHRTGSVRPIDARLFDLLYELAQTAGVEPRYRIISGYRSAATNAMLAARGNGVSSRSLHMEGKAIDVRLEGVPLASFRDLALARQAGGVGYYPGSDFVHLDTGRVRRWSG